MENYAQTDEGVQFIKNNFLDLALKLPEEQCADLLDAIIQKDF